MAGNRERIVSWRKFRLLVLGGEGDTGPNSQGKLWIQESSSRSLCQGCPQVSILLSSSLLGQLVHSFFETCFSSSSGLAQALYVRPLSTGQCAKLCGWKQRSKMSLGLHRALIPRREDLAFTFQLGIFKKLLIEI